MFVKSRSQLMTGDFCNEKQEASESEEVNRTNKREKMEQK